MTKGEKPSNFATDLDNLVLNKLITRDEHMPSNGQQIWDQCKDEPKNLTIYIALMRYDYTPLLQCLLFATNSKAKNLLSFDNSTERPFR